MSDLTERRQLPTHELPTAAGVTATQSHTAGGGPLRIHGRAHAARVRCQLDRGRGWQGLSPAAANFYGLGPRLRGDDNEKGRNMAIAYPRTRPKHCAGCKRRIYRGTVCKRCYLRTWQAGRSLMRIPR